MNITGNTILITGGGSGIGQALAVALQARGNKVIITGRREAALRETVAANPGMAYAVLDITDADAIRAFAAKVTAEHPDLNVVLHNAGIMLAEDLKVGAFDLEPVEATIETNLLGPMRLTSALLAHLKTKPAATIITVSSGLAFTTLAYTPTYCATKAGIHAWTEALRAQLVGSSVEVLELVPPAVATDLMPGHAESPHAMPLADFTREVVELIAANDTHRGEILVKNVYPLRFSEKNGYEAVFNAVNGIARH